MWNFNADGFFSAVENRNNNQEVIVRARTQDDIERLSEKIGVEWKESDPMADYPYRMVCQKTEWSNYLAVTALEINYDNFKDAMSKLFGIERIQQLHSVWAVMQRTPFDDYDFREPVPESDYADSVREQIEETRKKQLRQSLDNDFDTPLNRDR